MAMDANKVINQLTTALEILNRELRLLDPHIAFSKYWPWRDQVNKIVEDAFGTESDQYRQFLAIPDLESPDSFDFAMLRQIHHTNFMVLANKLEEIILGLRISGISEEPSLFDKMQFHHKVIEVSRELFRDGHYRDAIYRAFVEVNNFVKTKSGKQLDGKGLMSTVFSLNNPVIKINSLVTQTDKDEQEGFMYLFMGIMEGIRNPTGHENIIQNDPYRTLEYLGLASLLMKVAEEGKLVETE